MPDADDFAELRALQARAYGRDGGLSDAEAERLRRLETARAQGAPPPLVTQTVAEVAPDAARGADDESHDRGVDDRSADDHSGDDEPVVAEQGRARGGGSPGLLRRHGKIAAAASVLLLVLGFGAGWALFGRHAAGIELTAEEHQRRTEMESTGKFDDGTLRAIGRNDDALVWYGTKSAGKFGCVVLDTTAGSASSCSRMEVMDATGVSATTILESNGDGTEVQLSATALRATSGEIVAIIQSFDTGGYDWESQFTEAERVRSKELQAEGFLPFTYSVVGYFRGEPVWQTSTFDGASGERCLIVDAVDARSCTEDGESPESIVLHGSAPDEQGITRDWRVELAYSSNGATYLKVEGDTAAPEGAGDAG